MAQYRTSDLAAGAFPPDTLEIAEDAMRALEQWGRVPDIVRRVKTDIFTEKTSNRPMQRFMAIVLLTTCAGLGVLHKVKHPPQDIQNTWPRVQEVLEDWFISDDPLENLLEKIGMTCIAGY